MELTKERLEFIRKKTESKNSVFSDKKYLDSLFLPSGIIGREKQAEELLEYLCFKQGSIVPLISVYGRSGSGKSTVVKLVCQNLSDLSCTGFVNLRRSKTIFGCANAILEELGSEPLKSSVGLNKAIDVMEKGIKSILSSEKKSLFVLVLDEYDVIFSDQHGNPSDFLYKLLTLEENLREKGIWVCIVVISNTAVLDYELDDRVKSRMGEAEIYFKPYSESEVFNILKDRAAHAISKKVDEKVLKLCAELSSNEHGDCRRAIQLLCASAEIACDSEITKEHVIIASKNLERDNTDEAIKTCTVHQKLVLLAFAKCVLYSGKQTHSTQDIYDKYNSLQFDYKNLSYRRVFDLLIDLERSGLVERKTRSRGRYGYATEYILTVHEDIVGWIIDKDWWWEQRDQKARTDKYIEEAKEKYKVMKKMSK